MIPDSSQRVIADAKFTKIKFFSIIFLWIESKIII